VYFKVIVSGWLVVFLLAFVIGILVQDGASRYAWASFSAVTLLVMTVSYAIIIVNVQSNPHSQHHGSVQTERKLSVTLFIVTGASVLTILPWAIYLSLPGHLWKQLAEASRVDIVNPLALIYFASSIVNPFVYAIRMQEFRKAIKVLFGKSREPTGVNPSQPQTML